MLFSLALSFSLVVLSRVMFYVGGSFRKECVRALGLMANTMELDDSCSFGSRISFSWPLLWTMTKSISFVSVLES